MAKDQQDTIESLRAEMNRRDEQHAKDMAELRQMIGSINPQLVLQKVAETEKPEDKIQRLLDAMAAAAKVIETDLLAGPQKFRISCTVQPRLTKLVGGNSNIEAQAKYLQYSGIRAIMDPEKVQIKVEPLTAEEFAKLQPSAAA